MSRRTTDLLGEMQEIFGDSFGSLVESEELAEGPGRRMGKAARAMPSDKGLMKKGRSDKRRYKGKKKGDDFDRRSAKKISKLAAAAVARDPNNKAKQKKDVDKYKDAMRSIQKDMKKGSVKSSEQGGASTSGEGGGRASRGQGGAKTARRHFPFKRSSSLGPTSIEFVKPRTHKETKCWKCKCGNVYSDGCNCVSSGAGGKDCPPKGTMKKISYTKSYKRKYNDAYHKWRAEQGAKVSQRSGTKKTAL